LIGIYTDPGHRIAYDDGEVRQQFSICFECKITGGELSVSEESHQVGFFGVEEIETTGYAHCAESPDIRSS
jgi:hypothetical protein